mgnify:CR=1 FL=1
MLPGKIHDLTDFCFRYLIGVHTAHPDALLVNVQHDSNSLLATFVEILFQHVDDELHRREIVIDEKHLVKRRAFGLGLGPDRKLGVPARRAVRFVSHEFEVARQSALHVIAICPHEADNIMGWPRK